MLLIRLNQKVRGWLFLLHLEIRRHLAVGGQVEPKLFM